MHLLGPMDDSQVFGPQVRLRAVVRRRPRVDFLSSNQRGDQTIEIQL